MPNAEGRPKRRLALRIALALAVFAAALEGGVRLIVFSDSFAKTSLARALRSPARFGRPTSDDLYWQLDWRFKSVEQRGEVPNFDPVLGWKSDKIIGDDYRHVGESELGTRRPILLFGDSYAACMTPTEECFEGLFARTALADRYQLLNYGVGGYGLDQIELLVEHAIDHWRERHPIVIVGVMIDDDLDRSLLSVRDWPKPRYRLAGGELAVDPVPAPDTPEFRARFDVPPTSLAWKLLEHASRRLPWNDPSQRGTAAQEREKIELNRRILARLDAKLRSVNAEFFFVLFYYQSSVLKPSISGWRSAFLRTTLDELHAPWVATNEEMARVAVGDERKVESFFGGTHRTFGHFNAEGNRIAFHSILDGLRRFCDVPVDDAVLASVDAPRDKLLHVERYDSTVLRGAGAVVRYEFGSYREFPDPAEFERLCLRVGSEGPTEAHYLLDGRAHAFHGKLRFYPFRGEEGEKAHVVVHFLVDELEVKRVELRHGDAPLAVQIDLRDKNAFTIAVDDAGDGNLGDTIVFTAPKLE